MAASVVLLRGINLGSVNRVAMPALRQALSDAGFSGVRTHVQSGNVVLDTGLAPTELAASVRRILTDRLGLDVPVVTRTAEELAEVVSGNPFDEEATINARALQVTFSAEEVAPDLVAALATRAAPGERVVARGREIYSWHPHGIGRSKLALAITPKYAAATARNWTTVTTLLEMATTDAR